jgi:4'-phosphopantetheinyl transferase
MDSCLVWWASVDALPVRPESVLPAVEIERSRRLRRPEDRARQLLGAVLLRLAVGAATGTPPDRVTVDRTCRQCGAQHSRPLLPGTGLHASVTHSGDVVGLALTAVAPVGLDVERITDVDVDGLSRMVLHPDEQTGASGGSGPADFFVYWTRKEAVVKATGDGLRVPLAQVRVSAPGSPPELVAYPERPGLRAYLVDLNPPPGYLAALALLAPAPVPVVERPAAELLGERGPAQPA